jgi:hypothetical protein
MVAVGSQPLPDGNTFVRGGILTEPSTGWCFIGLTKRNTFTGASISDLPKDTDYYFGVLVAGGLTSTYGGVYYRGQRVKYFSNAAANILGYYTVRRKGNSLIMLRRAELTNIGTESEVSTVTIPEDEVDDALYPLYFQLPGANITFKRCWVSSTIIADSSRRYIDTDGGWVPRADRPMQLSLGFQSATTARYFGFLEHALRMNTTDVSTKEVVLRADLAIAVADVYESILLVCDQPFHVDTFSVADLFDDTPNGRLSVVGTCTPVIALSLPVTWSAPEHIWVSVRNRDPIVTRRFIFRVLHRDFSPVLMDGQTIFTLLVRGKTPKRPSNACNRDL